MENRRQRNTSSGDKFSFPVITPPGHDPGGDQFEFGPVTSPGSPNSPADHLFLNGKLLPHVFPIHQTPNSFSYSRSTSRTSSKDSLMSSRSNSTNSRSSNCSSARTSTSTEATSDQRRLSSNSCGAPAGRMSMRKERNNNYINNNNNKAALSAQYQYGSSQRWQLIAAAPVLMHQGSRSSRKGEVLERKGSKKSSRGVDEDRPGGAKSWFGRKVLKSFVSACQECHAIKT